MSDDNTDSSKVGFWGAIRDVMIAGMDRGQLLPAGLILIIIILCLKMPSQNVAGFFTDLKGIFYESHYYGWLLFVATVICWRVHTKKIKAINDAELKRITKARNSAQQKAANRRLNSSKK